VQGADVRHNANSEGHPDPSSAPEGSTRASGV
jgi:hypothetical protein